MTEINCYIGFSGLPTYGTSRYIIMSTPASKRLNTKMSFSPETHTVIDKKEWCFILSDLLEEKFETYMSPLQAELAEVKKDIKILKSNHEKTTTSLQQK